MALVNIASMGDAMVSYNVISSPSMQSAHPVSPSHRVSFNVGTQLLDTTIASILGSIQAPTPDHVLDSSHGMGRVRTNCTTGARVLP